MRRGRNSVCRRRKAAIRHTCNSRTTAWRHSTSATLRRTPLAHQRRPSQSHRLHRRQTMPTKEALKNGPQPSEKAPKRFSNLRSDVLPDVLAEALSLVVAEERRDYRIESEKRAAEERAARLQMEA